MNTLAEPLSQYYINPGTLYLSDLRVIFVPDHLRHSGK